METVKYNSNNHKVLSIESVKIKPSGNYLLFARKDGILIKRIYSGYSVTQARKMFKNYLNNL